MVLQARLAGPLAAVIPDDGVSETTAQFYAAGVVLALEQLHRDGVLYRGVCLDTLLLDCQGQLQVSVCANVMVSYTGAYRLNVYRKV